MSTSASTASPTKMEFDQSLVDRLSMALDLAKTAGADDANALLGDHQATSVSTRKGKTEEVEREEQRSLTLDVYLNNRHISISLNDLGGPALQQAVDRAMDMVKVVPENPYAGLVEAADFSTIRDAAGLDLNDPEDPQTPAMLDFAIEMETAALETSGITNSEGAQMSWGRSSYLMANSRGFLGGFHRTGYSASASPVAGQGEDMQRAYDWTAAVYRTDLKPALEVGQHAAQKAIARLGAKRLATAVMPVVFDKELSGRMIGTILGALHGSNITRGSSFLRDSMGEQIFAKNVSIIEDPLRPRGLRSAPFDGSGMATQGKKIIEDGVLKSWVLDIASARQLGLPSTGNTGFSGGTTQGNMRLVGGSGTFEALIADIAHGFYITSLMGHGANILTGDYSQGAAGFVIRNGQIAEPIENMTVAGQLSHMMKHATFAADDVYRSGMDAPSMRMDDMSVAGV